MLVGVALLSVLLTPDVSLPGEKKGYGLKVWPFFHYRTDPEGASTTLKILGPLVYWKRGVDEGEFAVRPLFYRTKNDKQDSLVIEYFYPLGKFKREGEYSRHYIVPFLRGRDDRRGGTRENHFSLFVFFQGQAESGESYGGVFPLAGTVVGRFGRDRIRFFLWPIYSDVVDEGANTCNVCWPILSTTKGGGRKGFRLWPFWGYKEEEGVSRTDFMLWPFFIRSKRRMDTDDPEREYFLFPLYRNVRSRGRRQVAILWPFFSHTVDERGGYRRWDMPWPFISFSRAEKMNRVMLFPLYHHKEAPGDRTRWILWPLYQCWDDQIGDQREVVKRYLLVNRIQTVFNGKGEVMRKEVSIWPLFTYSRKGDEVKLRLLNLIPIRHEGVERHWAPFYRVFGYERSASGKRWDIFWELYEREVHGNDGGEGNPMKGQGSGDGDEARRRVQLP